MTVRPDSRKPVIAAAAILAALGIVAAAAWYFATDLSSARRLAASADARDRLRAIDRLKGQSAARKTLELLSRDPDKWVAVKAVRALADQAGERTRRCLVRILQDKRIDPRARGEAATMLGRDKLADDDILARALAAPEPQVRAGAAKGLAERRDPNTIPQLVAALEDPSTEVRRWAITAIHKMIARRFPYDARKSPASQREVIERIKAYLKRCGVL
ncbi:MAG: HEAT repeat domain-containing protein [Planctomycetes bacterium]|nr:HEAT repeat domain-containing protein [Planctomycetota bacterium]